MAESKKKKKSSSLHPRVENQLTSSKSRCGHSARLSKAILLHKDENAINFFC